MEEEFTKEVKIPEERVGVLIGKNGSIKNELEKRFNTKIFINEDNVITLTGPDSLKIWTCEKVIKAIGRGFNPEIAKLIEREDYDFELIKLNEFTRSKNDMKRLKGRVIGCEGISKEQIEKKTGSYLSIYGKTIGIVAKFEVIHIVRTAIEMLLNGARHSTAFKYIDKENQKRVRELMLK